MKRFLMKWAFDQTAFDEADFQTDDQTAIDEADGKVFLSCGRFDHVGFRSCCWSPIWAMA
jgi:hypothetical protein